MKSTKFGHCCLLVEENGVRILTDPGSYSTQQTQVKNIDFVLITHEHEDHLHVDSLKALLENNPQAKIITNKSVGALLEKEGIGCICFSPLAQGLLTDKYLKGIPKDSRAAKPHGFLKREQITEAVEKKVAALNELAKKRGQSLAQMALAWVLRDKRVTTVLIGASKVKQLEQNVAALDNLHFADDELNQIEKILKGA